jgi:starch-binding outer membrane protein, SusD/RagB family
MIRKYNNKKITGKVLILIFFLIPMMSCQDYLDVVPDNVSTLDHAFKLRNEAEKYLFTCYSYLPHNGYESSNIGMLAGDEIWVAYRKGIYSLGSDIARGYQQVTNPFMNAWDGNNQAKPVFDAIRHCNTFLENVSDKNKVLDLTDKERGRWLGEVQFLKAYYHFYLLRMYGPIPIIDKNLPVDASEGEVNVERKPVDECVDYIVALLDSATNRLPTRITDITNELGRVTRPIALSVKAQVLLTAASPLFNGNTDLGSLVNKNGEPLFNQDYDASKWEKARDAAIDAVEAAEFSGNSLYYFDNNTFHLTDTTMTQMSIRQAVCERWNNEIVWANSQTTTTSLQRDCMVPLAVGENHGYMRSILSPPLKIARMFYTKNGVPIEEDITLDFSNETKIRKAVSSERFNIKAGYETARLNFDREPRFYADLAFDGAVWYKYDSPSATDENTYYVEAKYGDFAGSSHQIYFNVTGYYIKKLVDWNMSVGSSNASYKNYAWPEIRLAELYLMVAEAQNEAEGPGSVAYDYLNKIRARAGLPTVQESWTNYSIKPDKYKTKDGLREIIHRERLIELAFEGKRFWDLRRWKKATEELNKPITGWNVLGTDNETYFQITTLYQQEFIAPRDYFWPISESELLRNPNLKQNLGW